MSDVAAMMTANASPAAFSMNKFRVPGTNTFIDPMAEAERVRRFNAKGMMSQWGDIGHPASIAALMMGGAMPAAMGSGGLFGGKGGLLGDMPGGNWISNGMGNMSRLPGLLGGMSGGAGGAADPETLQRLEQERRARQLEDQERMTRARQLLTTLRGYI